MDLLGLLNSHNGVDGTINIFDAGIPGDGRCLFRSVVHGACLRAGKPSPRESQEKELADDLRAAVKTILLYVLSTMEGIQMLIYILLTPLDYAGC